MKKATPKQPKSNVFSITGKPISGSNKKNEGERIPLEIPIVLEIGGSAGCIADEATAKIESAINYSNSIFALIQRSCAYQIHEPKSEMDVLCDIENACVIGMAINNSIDEAVFAGRWRNEKEIHPTAAADRDADGGS